MNISPNKLVIRRLLKHDRAQVFSALTDPAKMAKWFYGMETGQAKVTIDLRPGGNFEIEMFNEKGGGGVQATRQLLGNRSSGKSSLYLDVGGFC